MYIAMYIITVFKSCMRFLLLSVACVCMCACAYACMCVCVCVCDTYISGYIDVHTYVAITGFYQDIFLNV